MAGDREYRRRMHEAGRLDRWLTGHACSVYEWLFWWDFYLGVARLFDAAHAAPRREE
jgi:hypothetical protein